MAKKSFKTDNPAMQFITDNKQSTDYTHNAEEQEKETKSKRLNLLIQPSLLKDLKKIAYVKRVSLNELITSTMQEYTDTQGEAIKKYNDFVGEEEE